MARAYKPRPRVPHSMPLAEKLLAYSRQAENGCRVWTRALHKAGYGTIRHNGRKTYAHRVSYEAAIGPIPEGLQIDHLCRNRACINPAHLEAVTVQENLLRGVGPTGTNARKTHCKRGHEFTPDNVRRPKSEPRSRACRQCGRDNRKAWGERVGCRARRRIPEAVE